MENNSFGFQETKFSEVTQPKPNNYMALSIVATILGFCYWNNWWNCGYCNVFTIINKIS